MRRWLYLAAGMASMLFMGLVEGWTIFVIPFREAFPDWSLTQLSVVLTLVELDFAVGAILAARMLIKIKKPRASLLLAAFMECFAWLCLSRLDTGAPGQSLIVLYVLYGLILGVANGIYYNTVVVIISANFQDRQGTVSGMLVMMFGLGQLVIGAGTSALVGKLGLFDTFAIVGIVFGIVLFAGAAVMGGADTRAPAEKVNPNFSGEQVSTREMVKRADFWLFCLILVMFNTSGFFGLSSASPMADAYGMPAVLGLIISAGNMISRPLMGILYDRLGRRSALGIAVSLLIIADALFFAGDKTGISALILAGLLALGMCLGSAPSLSPVYANAEYGQEHFASNLSVITCAMVPAAIAGPPFASMLTDRANGDFVPAFTMIGVLAALALALYLILEYVKKKEALK
ncbi:MAG: MFS transporter [Anaerovoracaceae bacterium]|nr:MFS transporter [Anaerovoracaceae bacterium]